MVARRSAPGSLVHTPSGPRKSGIPDPVETPAPVMTTTDEDDSMSERASSKEREVTRANSKSWQLVRGSSVFDKPAMKRHRIRYRQDDYGLSSSANTSPITLVILCAGS